jgi:hypothetical protein
VKFPLKIITISRSSNTCKASVSEQYSRWPYFNGLNVSKKKKLLQLDQKK